MQYYDSTPYKCCLVVNEFFLTKERIQHSSTLIVFCGLLGLSVLLSRLVHSFLLRMYPIVYLATPGAFAVSLILLLCFSA